MSAKELFEELGKKEEAWETIYKLTKDKKTVTVILKYCDMTKKIYVTSVWTPSFSIDGSFSNDNVDILFKAIKQQLKEMEEIPWLP